MNEFEVFDIDLLSGSLFVKGLDSINWKTNRTVQIVARDQLGLEDTLSIIVCYHEEMVLRLQFFNSYVHIFR
jgi:hypothetical protein